MFKQALVSTSDKRGLDVLAKWLNSQGCKIISTGGTSKFIRNLGIPVVEVGELTGFPEMMDGRVRTLHPYVHMGLLARSFVPGDFELLKEHGISPFDLVIVNLYPFEKAWQSGKKGADLIEEIDVGGPTMLRAAAKSYERLTVVCDPDDYQKIMTEESTLESRQKLAVKVFEHTSYYDSVVSQGIRGDLPFDSKEWALGLRTKSKLRYGENPHQKAVWCESIYANPLGLTNAIQHQGKELSFNNILDLEAAVGVVSDFAEPCCAIIKHLTPCGVALKKTARESFDAALKADPVSAFGGIVALNREVDGETANAMRSLFLECVIAPSFSFEALKIFSEKKNLRVLSLDGLKSFQNSEQSLELRTLRGGALVQTVDSAPVWSPEWRGVGREISEAVKSDMLLAFRLVRHVKSNAITIAENGVLIGQCGGQTNRIDSVRMALERAKAKGSEAVLASDAFFPFRDSVDMAHKAGIKWIIQPGGSLRDGEVEKAVLDNGMGMILTGTRHFKH